MDTESKQGPYHDAALDLLLLLNRLLQVFHLGFEPFRRPLFNRQIAGRLVASLQARARGACEREAASE